MKRGTFNAKYIRLYTPCIN